MAIKGTVKIELFEAGKKVKEVKHSNTFQSSLIQSWFNPIGYNGKTPYTLPDVASKEIWKHLVGGLWLLDDSDKLISVGDEMVPAGVSMTGNGAYGVSNSGTPNEFGSYNSLEEVVGADSITMVWDFTTAQANGKITTVCLTTDWAGYAGLGNASQNNANTLMDMVTGQDTSFYESVAVGLAGYASNDKQYQGVIDWGEGTLTLYERDTWYDSYDLIKSNPNITDVIDTKYDLTFTPIPISLYTSRAFIDRRYLMFLVVNRSCSPNDKMYVVKVDCISHTLERIEVTNTTGLTILANQQSGAYTSTKAYAFIDADTLLVHASDNGTVESFLIDIDTSVSTSLGEITTESLLASKHNGSTVSYQLSDSGKVIIGNMIFDKKLGTLYPTNGQYAGTYQVCNNHKHRTLVHHMQYANRVYMMHNPLMMHTIAVLDNAVTKGATQSMKVSYTLTRSV